MAFLHEFWDGQVHVVISIYYHGLGLYESSEISLPEIVLQFRIAPVEIIKVLAFRVDVFIFDLIVIVAIIAKLSAVDIFEVPSIVRIHCEGCFSSWIPLL